MANIPNGIPTRSPFSPQPLRYAIPPQRGLAPGSPDAPGDGHAVVGLLGATFGVRVTGIVGSAFPVLTRVGSIGFLQPIVLLNVSLASSITNTSATNVAVLAVHKDLGTQINLTSGDSYLSEHIVEQSLSHSIRTGTSYSDNIAPTYGTNERIALYAVMPDAGCAFTAIVNIRYLTID